MLSRCFFDFSLVVRAFVIKWVRSLPFSLVSKFSHANYYHIINVETALSISFEFKNICDFRCPDVLPLHM